MGSIIPCCNASGADSRLPNAPVGSSSLFWNFCLMQMELWSSCLGELIPFFNSIYFPPKRVHHVKINYAEPTTLSAQCENLAETNLYSIRSLRQFSTRLSLFSHWESWTAHLSHLMCSYTPARSTPWRLGQQDWPLPVAPIFFSVLVRSWILLTPTEYVLSFNDCVASVFWLPHSLSVDNPFSDQLLLHISIHPPSSKLQPGEGEGGGRHQFTWRNWNRHIQICIII